MSRCLIDEPRLNYYVVIKILWKTITLETL